MGSAHADSFSWSLTGRISGSTADLACPSITQCTAVGVAGGAASEQTFDPTAPGNPIPIAIDLFPAGTEVACPSISQCTAVGGGGDDDSGNVVTFDPNAPGVPTSTGIDVYNMFDAVACPSTTQCSALDNGGSEFTFDPNAPGNPTSAQIDYDYGGGGLEFYPSSLACPSMAQCTAVDPLGYEMTFDPAAPGNATNVLIDSAEMSAVACPSSSQCTAVDNHPAGFEVTFDPTTAGSPTPVGIDMYGGFSSIACPSRSQCTAVGSGPVSGEDVTFDPTAPGSPSPVAIPGATYLERITCPSVSKCVAVDIDGNVFVGTQTTPPPTPPLSITAVTFQQRNVASGKVEAVPSTGTVDGNQVDVIATLQNNTATALQTDVSFGDPTDDSATPGITQSGVTVPADGSLDVDEVLNTNGLAWDDNGKPDPDRTIAVTLPDGSTYSTTLTVEPKPVILVHGYYSDYKTWASYEGADGFLARANPYWFGFAVGDTPGWGVMNTSPFSIPGNTIAENAKQEEMYIEHVRVDKKAAHVDIVAHSMGGTISRYFIQDLMPDLPARDPLPIVSHLVMLGTPNLGSECADDLQAAVPVPFGLNTPTWQLTPEYMIHSFNRQVTDDRGVQFSILAGDPDQSYSCTGYRDNDGVVGVPSALWTIHPRTLMRVFHTAMTSFKNAFTQWVKPRLAIGPVAAHGGNYLGPAASLSALDLPGGPPNAETRPTLVRTFTARSLARLRVAATSVPAMAGGGMLTARPRQTAAFAISVPARGGKLTVTLLAQPTVTTQLIAPGGRIAQTIAAESGAADGLFRTMSVKSPHAGRWRLRVTVQGGAATSQVAIGVQFAHPIVYVTLTLSQLTRKHKRSSSHWLRFTARVKDDGRPANGARVTLILSGSGQRALVLHLHARHGSTGAYVATTTAPKSPTTVLVNAAVHASKATSTFELSTSCARGLGDNLAPIYGP